MRHVFVLLVTICAFVTIKKYRTVWQKLPARWRSRLIDWAALLYFAFRRLRLEIISVFTVRTDILKRSRVPLPVVIGRNRNSGEIILIASTPPRARRIVAHFWRHHSDHSRGELLRLAKKHGVSSGQLRFIGAIRHLPRSGKMVLPLVFDLSIDLVGGYVTLCHACPHGHPKSLSAMCLHKAARLVLDGVAISDVLGPLVGENICPSLMPKKK